MTVKFTSDGSVTYSGFLASYTSIGQTVECKFFKTTNTSNTRFFYQIHISFSVFFSCCRKFCFSRCSVQNAEYVASCLFHFAITTAGVVLCRGRKQLPRALFKV